MKWIARSKDKQNSKVFISTNCHAGRLYKIGTPAGKYVQTFIFPKHQPQWIIS